MNAASSATPMSPLESGAPASLVYMLHGVFAVHDGPKGYSTVEVQQGVITAMDPESITVTSPDGYIRTYPLALPLQAYDGLAIGCRVTAMLPAGGALELTEIGDPPADGSRISALVPVVPLGRPAPPAVEAEAYDDPREVETRDDADGADGPRA